MTPAKFRLPRDIPLDEYPSPDAYLEEAQRLTLEAQKQGLILRVMGPIALHLYFPDHVALYRRMERLGERVFTDIDYAAYGKHRGKMIDFFASQGYEVERRALMLSGGERHIYFGGRIPMVDVFFDRLNYNHPIDYQGRLELHPYCVTLTDLLLQKLQIVHINDKDLKDAMLLLLAGVLGRDEAVGASPEYIARRMSDDWGFWYTATENLAKIKSSMEQVPALTPEHCSMIRANADALLQAIEQAPKSGHWKSRAKVGTRKPWYKEVTDW
ncbi:MAG: hypothetical protein A2Z66_05905 [Chloroflexi bacterium RBG_13_66_10]|nr:MAG: hypothetical protein A2Z66_05905 [Chloroflexi bacterium RBG_13_66_10]